MATPPDRLAIIVPVLDEAGTLASLKNHLHHWQSRGVEVVVVDGGSSDDGPEQLRHAGFQVVPAPRGRARQMNAGAQATNASRLLFLHADTRLPAGADDQVRAALRPSTGDWGRFDVRIEGHSRMLPVVAWFMNHRSRLTGIATGDQGLFMTRTAFEQVGGFPDQPLMEDVEICKRLKQISAPVCLKHRVTTSGRRWDNRGSWRTIWLMWQLRWAYWRGTPADQLAERYS
ncbi:transferase 2, rSAM/selenodomain-associated [Marinobacter persicus]|uniref:Transferase 2, rSAM/selenodomain-associated n=1 Tax=Marinobacter persicus TaxID=930118 RepID=A0A1I3VA09_9GAMM|nr:TIGR04283 family arsenosugar biosynthesis glycosyltransferase [Marinobacter persicus]GHD41431.1 glycosyl transferase [Marinobacter persicus]SFJ91813.1 transferase 2, rSAM/selenodomain-associated [Marinobacter persicus]